MRYAKPIFVVLVITHAVLCQTNHNSYRLGDSDSVWQQALGTPVPIDRDGYSYSKAHAYTRSWYTGPVSRTGANYAGYSADNYSVKLIRFDWPRSRTLAAARRAVVAVLPVDSKRSNTERRRTTVVENYRSENLAKRIHPLFAGARDCITPWGYGPGIIRVRYSLRRGRVAQVIIDVGEPHEVPSNVCS